MVKYLGDGMLAVFMEEKGELSPEEKAVGVAREIIEYVKNSDQSELDHGCQIGVAINTGKALVGYVGTQERAEFNVMGNLIKMTYRMQERAIPNRIFIGASTAEAITNKYPIQKAGNLTMVGIEQPIQVFEISLAKTSPFIQEDNEMVAAFKAIAEKLKAHRN
jgi:adenylate cyclase